MDFLELIDSATSILSGKKTVFLEPRGRITVVGDVHADATTFNIVKRKISGKAVFLGDYGDRGDEPVEVYTEILKMLLDDEAILLRGNHESAGVYPHELPGQLRGIFGEEAEEIERALMKFWEKLPVSAVVDGELWLAHGGVPTKKCRVDEEGIEAREVLKPDEYTSLEIMWNDPWEKERCGDNYIRGVMYFYGKIATRALLNALDVKVVVRSHEPQKVLKVEQDGMVVTVGSCAVPYESSKAAVIKIDFSKKFRNGYDLARFGEVFEVRY